jgi:hypothetical protein
VICAHYGVFAEQWEAADWCACDSIVPAVSGLGLHRGAEGDAVGGVAICVHP